MATIGDIQNFVEGLPEDTLAVLVVQRGMRPFVLRTDNMTLSDKLEKMRYPNWPLAVWEGLAQATGGTGTPPLLDDAIDREMEE